MGMAGSLMDIQVNYPQEVNLNQQQRFSIANDI